MMQLHFSLFGKLSATARELFIVLALLDLFLSDFSWASESEVDRHLEMGKKLLAAGQLADALTHFHAAVDLDPNNYQTYYRRAAVFMALGKSKSALPDLDKAIELQPDFLGALLHRGNIYLKFGRLSEAKADFNKVLTLESSNFEAQSQLQSLGSLADNVENAKNLFENNMEKEAVEFLSKALDVSPFDSSLRLLRADYYESMGEGMKAANDLRSVNKLTNDNTGGYLRVSKLLYRLGEPEQSLMEIRECLKLDPDHKQCFAHYKHIKKVAKAYEACTKFTESNDWSTCLEKIGKVRKLTDNVAGMQRLLDQQECFCSSKNGDPSAVDICTSLLNNDPKNVYILCNRGEAYLNTEQYEDAIRDFQAVLEVDKGHQRAKEGIERAQKMLKSSKRRDYYKILGVNRSARKRDILKAYRKLAAKYHPDHYKGSDRKAAEKKFIDISDAKEVLSDNEKRSKFDNGEDPLDPNQQHQGFDPFGGGGFTFQNFDPFETGGFEFFFG